MTNVDSPNWPAIITPIYLSLCCTNTIISLSRAVRAVWSVAARTAARAICPDNATHVLSPNHHSPCEATAINYFHSRVFGLIVYCTVHSADALAARAAFNRTMTRTS
jgi:hypothetical protein